MPNSPLDWGPLVDRDETIAPPLLYLVHGAYLAPLLAPLFRESSHHWLMRQCGPVVVFAGRKMVNAHESVGFCTVTANFSRTEGAEPTKVYAEAETIDQALYDATEQVLDLLMAPMPMRG